MELNQGQEEEILAFEKQLVDELPAFKGESVDIIRNWREKRGKRKI